MKFTLFYKGKIPSKGGPKFKHDLRIKFHKQLEMMFHLPPLEHHKDWINKSDAPELYPELYPIKDNKNLFCLVSHKLNMYVSLKVQLYSRYKNRSFKDIDNKLKMIFDALQIPKTEEFLTKWRKENNVDGPLICLLSDDRLIYELEVATDYILDEKYLDRNNMICLIEVRIKGNRFIEKYADLTV